MMRDTAPSGARILTLEITLEESNPPIWRRLQIADCATMGDLHYAIQIVMGWSNSHLHEFRAGRRRIGEVWPDDDYDQNPEKDEEDVELRDVLKRKGAKLEYIYDFGDYWVHQVVVEEISEPQPGVRYPVCTGGERSCPPDDCGGMGRYYRMLEILEDPEHKEYETYREWLPEDFDPDDFDLNKTNEELKRMDEWRGMAEGEDESGTFAAPPAGSPYEEPVSRLLTLGEPKSKVDYTTLGIGQEHVPDLIRMVTDMTLHRADSGRTEVWAPVHAWRALAQFRAEAAIDPLVDLLRMVDEYQDDWAGDDLPDVLGEIGAPAVPAVSAFLQDESRGLWGRVAASSSLSAIGQRYPEARADCVAALTAQLERCAENHEELNAYLVSALMDLNAVESAPVMERAFAADSVDLGVQGDWEDVQIQLGLLDMRSRPRPPLGWLAPEILGTQRPHNHTVSPPHLSKTHQKAKKKRKQQKKARRNNRGK